MRGPRFTGPSIAAHAGGFAMIWPPGTVERPCAAPIDATCTGRPRGAGQRRTSGCVRASTSAVRVHKAPGHAGVRALRRVGVGVSIAVNEGAARIREQKSARLTSALLPSWDGASDDFSTATVRYNVYADDALVVPMTSQGAVGFQLCSGQLSGTGPFADFEGGSGKYRVRAVDLAGNEDTNNVTQEVTVSCGSGSGCACVTAGGSPSELAVPLLLVLCGLASTKPRIRRARAGSGRCRRP